MRFGLVTENNATPGLRKLAAASGDLTPVYDAFGQVVVTNTIERFEKEQAPDGSPWQPSIRVQESGGKTLQDQGYVKDSIHHRVEVDGVFIGSPFGWLIVHQEGWTIRAKNAPYLMFNVGGHFVKVKEVTMPQREIFGISPDDEADLDEVLDSYFRRAA